MIFWSGFAASIGAVSLFYWFIMWSRRESVVRAFATLLWLVSFPAMAGVIQQTLGHHRHLTWEQIRKDGSENIVVLGHKIVTDVAIYLYIDKAGEPLALALPYDRELAQELQDAAREGRGVHGTIPYDRSLALDEDLEFHPPPQPKALPNKPLEKPKVYERST